MTLVCPNFLFFILDGWWVTELLFTWYTCIHHLDESECTTRWAGRGKKGWKVTGNWKCKRCEESTTRAGKLIFFQFALATCASFPSPRRRLRNDVDLSWRRCRKWNFLRLFLSSPPPGRLRSCHDQFNCYALERFNYKRLPRCLI